MNWYLKCLKQFADFEGRARRTEYWTFNLANFVISLALCYININLSYIFGLVMFLPALAVQVRRLHDVGKNGWWVLIALVPFIGSIALLVFSLLDSVHGENQYGPNPKGL